MDLQKGNLRVGTWKPGTLIGTALAHTGDPSPVDAWVSEPARLICWPFVDLRRFIDKRPEQRVLLQRLVNDDFARKLVVSLR